MAEACTILLSSPSFLLHVQYMFIQVYRQNHDMLRQDWQEHEAILPTASVPIATDKVDIANLPLMKQIHADHQKQRQAMMSHLRRRRDAQVHKQIEAAARYNAAHEQLHIHSAGRRLANLLHLAAQLLCERQRS